MTQKILVFLLLKENGSNRVVETTREEYNMDGTIVFNPEFDEGTGFILQEFKVLKNFHQRKDVTMAIQMVYQVMEDEENWRPYPAMLKFYYFVQSKTFYSVV